jgi:hypothetical protein
MAEFTARGKAFLFPKGQSGRAATPMDSRRFLTSAVSSRASFPGNDARLAIGKIWLPEESETRAR